MGQVDLFFLRRSHKVRRHVIHAHLPGQLEEQLPSVIIRELPDENRFKAVRYRECGDRSRPGPAQAKRHRPRCGRCLRRWIDPDRSDCFFQHPGVLQLFIPEFPQRSERNFRPGHRRARNLGDECIVKPHACTLECESAAELVYEFGRAFPCHCLQDGTRYALEVPGIGTESAALPSAIYRPGISAMAFWSPELRLNGPYDLGSGLCPLARPFRSWLKRRSRRWNCPFPEPLHPSFPLRALLRT